MPARLNPGAAGLAALGAYALYMAPVALTGHWTWPGYNFVNDTAPNFLYADLLSRQGMSLPAAIDSTTAVIQAAPVNLGYPVGAHGLLATVQPLTGADLPAVYHPIIAAVAGPGGDGDGSARPASGAGSLPAAVAGVLPVGAVLLYRYGLHGSIKEELVVALMATAAALAREALDRELSIRLAVLIALCAAALLHVFSAVGAAYALVLGLLLLAVALVEGRGVVAIGRLAGAGVAIARGGGRREPLGRHELRQARGGHFRQRGGREHGLPRPSASSASARPGRGRLVLAGLPRARPAAGRHGEHPRRRRDRASRGRRHRSGARRRRPAGLLLLIPDGGGRGRSGPPALTIRRRQAARRAVTGRCPDGRDRWLHAVGPSEFAGCKCSRDWRWRSWSPACSCPTAWATAWPRSLRLTAWTR